VRRLAPIAQELGCTLGQMAIAWCLKNPHVSSVITGASRVAQVHENMKAVDVVPRLTPEVMARIDAALAGG
jgi:aryl-alcohol dehydrogenase-like predicted oxidoreductase